jgi:shikimate kinase
MNIVIIGYRASGKTRVGRRVAQRLGWPYVDVDRGIEKATNKTIKQIFEENGEPYYRQVEAGVAREMLGGDGQVVSFGGGTLMEPPNQALINHHVLVVYLEAPVDVLWQRAQADPESEKNRPPLLKSKGGREEIVDMLKKRAPVYEQFANLTLDATQDPEFLVDRVIEALPQAGPARDG